MAQQRSNNQRTEAWMRQESARAEREAERKRKEAEKQHREEHVRKQHESAEHKTRAVERQVEKLQGILSSALSQPVIRPKFEDMKRSLSLPALNLGPDANPTPAPKWEQFAPAPPGALGRIFGGKQRFARERAIAEQSFDAALERHKDGEVARQQRVVESRKQHEAQKKAQKERITQHNTSIDDFERKFRAKDRHAVSNYFQQVLDAIKDPRGFPSARRAGYVPESTLLAIEWELPSMTTIPTEKEFTYVKSRDAVETRKSRPLTEIRGNYQDLVAQMALRALHAVFQADPSGIVQTVVFNGIVEDTDPSTGHKIRPCLITLRATREHFDRVNLHDVTPVKCVQHHFAADVSAHPEELTPVAPLLNFNMADPRIVDPVDVMSDLDQRPNLLEFSASEFEHFIQNLFAHMGFDTKQFQANGDGGIDCVAYDPTPIRGGKYVIQVKLYTKTVQPTAVRDLYGVVQHEGATKGILITTSGFGPSSHEFVNNKPIQLYDGPSLLALCHEHDIPARILHTTKTRKKGK